MNSSNQMASKNSNVFKSNIKSSFILFIVLFISLISPIAGLVGGINGKITALSLIGVCLVCSSLLMVILNKKLPWMETGFVGLITIWYLTIFLKYFDKIENNQVGETWITISQIVYIFYIIILFQFNKFSHEILESDLAKSLQSKMDAASSKSTWIIILLLTWLILIQYLILVYFTTDG